MKNIILLKRVFSHFGAFEIASVTHPVGQRGLAPGKIPFGRLENHDWQPRIQEAEAVAAQAHDGREELLHVQGQEEEISFVQGKEQRLCFAGVAVKRYSTSKVRETQVRR